MLKTHRIGLIACLLHVFSNPSPHLVVKFFDFRLNHLVDLGLGSEHLGDILGSDTCKTGLDTRISNGKCGFADFLSSNSLPLGVDGNVGFSTLFPFDQHFVFFSKLVEGLWDFAGFDLDA